MTSKDFDVQQESCIVLFRPLTDEAQQWLEEHTGADAQWWGGALVVEYRYAADFAQAILNAVNGGENE